jgi:hypothetical protein
MRTIKFFLLLISAAMLCKHAHAQKNRWTVKAGQSIEQVLGDSNIFRYAQFMPGVIHYKNETVSHALFNLNHITGELQYIAPSKDTLAVGNETSINYVTIQADTFYFDKVFIELIHGNALAKLGKIEIIKMGNIEKEGAYGQMSSTASIESIDAYYSGSQTYKLSAKSTMTLEKRTLFFVGNNNNNFLPASKKNITKMFGEKKAAIESFIKENKITFSDEDDLIKIIDFLGKI